MYTKICQLKTLYINVCRSAKNDWDEVQSMHGRKGWILHMVSLSDGEWKIMNRLWESEGSTITELTAALQEETGWDKHIIITMLNRMEKKEAIAHRKDGRAKVFYPIVPRGEVSMQETRGFLQKVYSGSLGMMVNAMVEDQALSKDEIQELYEILEQAKRKK